ncbi:TPA_asm: hypothetical protein GZX72_14225 [Listeria monocytogenes]|nr:hypothetical protein [Listeria monocytogenes]
MKQLSHDMKKELIETIEKLLESDITAYRIEKETNVNQSKIGKLKRREIKINNLTVNVALKLYEFAKKNHVK